MSKIIVSRHPAAVQFVAEEIGGERDGNSVTIYRDTGEPDGDNPTMNCRVVVEEIPVLVEATPEQVAGKTVYGNLPLHLAAMANIVFAIEFKGSAPRGAEYGVAEMRAAGARLMPYVVVRGEE